MDHITQLYQNRAKVLQEEVTRLEALLEAVKDIELGNTEDVSVSSSREISAPTIGNSKKKKEKEPVTSIYGQPVTTQEIAQQDPLSTLGGEALDLAKAGAAKLGTKVLQNLLPIAGIVGTELLVKKVTGKTLLGRTIDAIKAKRQEKIKTAEEAAKAALELAADIAKSEKQSQTALRIAKEIKPGDMDPTLGILRRPESEIPVGKVGSLTPAGREKIAQVLQSTGEDLTSATKELIRAKPGETHKYLKSAGAITPEDIEMGLKGAKDIAMTGKEVAGKVGRAATTPLPGSSSAVASGLAQLGAGIAGEYAGEYLVKPAAEKIGLTDLLAKGISTVVPNSILAAGNSPAEDERADEEISNNLKRMGIRSGRLRGPMGIDIGKK